MVDRAAIALQVEKIRAVVEQAGIATIDSEELRLLCPDELSGSEQFMQIATIAHTEQWSFAFLPDGTLIFAGYATA